MPIVTPAFTNRQLTIFNIFILGLGAALIMISTLEHLITRRNLRGVILGALFGFAVTISTVPVTSWVTVVFPVGLFALIGFMFSVLPTKLSEYALYMNIKDDENEPYGWSEPSRPAPSLDAVRPDAIIHPGKPAEPKIVGYQHVPRPDAGCVVIIPVKQ